MIRTHEHTNPQPQPTQNDRADRHPTWCDRSRCTADPASYRPGVGGEYRSARVSLNLTAAMWLPVRDGTAWLTETCAPWPCEPFLRVQVGDAYLSMLADNARRVLGALSTLLASAATGPEVTR